MFVLMFAWMLACAWMHAWMHACMYMHACLHAYVHVYGMQSMTPETNTNTPICQQSQPPPPPAAAPLYHQGCRTVLLPEIAQRDEHSSEPSRNAVQQGCPPRPRSLPLLRHRHRPVEPGPFSQRMTPRCSVCHSYFPDAGPWTCRVGQRHCQQHGERALGEAKHTS